MRSTLTAEITTKKLISQTSIKWIYGGLFFLCAMPFVSPTIALSIGIFLSICGIKLEKSSTYTSTILQASIVFLGFGMSLTQVINASKTAFFDTAISVVVVMICGILLGKLLKIDKNTTLLIASGTAICGGSAIASVSSVLGSKDSENSVALAVIFILNAVALFIFPFIGHQLNLSQEVFGNWAAIAIHDTSSVIGAGAVYGDEALQIATSVKLVRALWIIPLSLIIALFNKNKSKGKVKIPYFMLLFVVAIIIAHYLPTYSATFNHIHWLGKRGMVVALLLIGSNISIQEAKKTGSKIFILGIGLWAIIAIGSLITLTS